MSLIAFLYKSSQSMLTLFDVITTGDDVKAEGQGFNLQGKLDVDGILDDFKNSCLQFLKKRHSYLLALLCFACLQHYTPSETSLHGMHV